MNDLLATVDDLRRMSSAELIQLGEDSLLNRIRDQAREARARHGSLRPSNLETFLTDPECVRYPARLVFEFGEMGTHQFAQPEPDYRNPNGCILYVRPVLAQRPDLLALALSYMIPVINYWELVGDQHCLAYGSILQNMDESSYYQAVCHMADFTAANVLGQNDPRAHVPQDQSQPAAPCQPGCGCAS